MHFSLVKLMPEGHLAVNGLDDVILPLRYALERLGFAVEIKVNEVNPHSRNIIFGSCNVPKAASAALPRNSIVFNLEQFTEGSPWVNSAYARHLADFPVWDYSPRNVAFLKDKLGLSNVTGIRLGYVPEMTRLNEALPQNVDVLFYGSVNERRKLALQKLAEAGINLKILQGVYGAERDAWIARSKVILNVHHYAPASLEVPRLGYLWANKKAVVSELRPDTEIYPELTEACCFCDYNRLADAVGETLADGKARKKQAEAGFAAFSSISFADGLRNIVGRRSFKGGAGQTQPA